MDGLLVYGGKTVTAKEEGEKRGSESWERKRIKRKREGGRGGEEVGREEKDEEGGRGVGG